MKQIFTLLIIMLIGLSAAAQKDYSGSNAKYFEDGNNLEHAVKIYPLDFFLGKFGAAYEIKALDWLMVGAEGGAIVNKYYKQGIWDWFGNSGSIAVNGGFYLGFQAMYNLQEDYLGEYLGVGFMYQYTSLQNAETSTTDYISFSGARISKQYAFSDHFFVEGFFAVGISRSNINDPTSTAGIDAMANVGIGYLFNP